MPGEGESGFTAKPCNIRERVNPGMPGEGESGFTAKPCNIKERTEQGNRKSSAGKRNDWNKK
jgi:hypothetical protein